MVCPYKVTISNNNLYREFAISESIERVCLGTTPGCEFRLNREDFFDTIKLTFVRSESGWQVFCNDSVYLSVGDVRKLGFSKISHGDIFSVRYSSNGSDIFELSFSMDFEAQIPVFNFCADIRSLSGVVISDKERADFIVKSEYCKDVSVFVSKSGSDYYVEEKQTPFGLYINGRRVEGKAQIKEYDFLSISDVFFFFKGNFVYYDEAKVEIPALVCREIEPDSVFEYPLFVRNTRRKIQPDTDPIKILDPSKKPTKPEKNILTSLMPAVIMLILVIVLRGIMSSNAGTYVIFSVCSMGIGIFTSASSLVQGKKKYKNEIRHREEAYKEYIEKKEKEIWDAREREIQILGEIYHSPVKGIEKVLNFESDIFDRIPEDEDFLDVCLGFGSRLSGRQIEYKSQEQLEEGDELTLIPEHLFEKYRYIDNAPITISLRNAGAVGITGDDNSRYQMFKNILADVVCRQFHSEITIYLLLDDKIEKYEWVKRLPQLQQSDGSRNIVYDNSSKTIIFENLYKELTFRSTNKNSYKPILIFVLDNHDITNHPVSKYIATAATIQTTFLFFEKSVDFLPLYCTEIIELSGSRSGIVYKSSDKSKVESFTYEMIDDSKMRALVDKIAPVYSEEISLASALRKNISMFQMLGIYMASDIDLEKNWFESRICDTMAAPLGVNAKDEIVYLDLHEKAHGPHGLVAGTTGSGKSEILQTYILSMACFYHPYEVSFVIIDFKGGGMVNQFADLPHLIGAITNIDGKEIDRSLKSIRAELLKRQTLFAEAGVNNIEKYIRAYKNGAVKIALPHLIIIVDEFAELKAEQPEFMKELISASRIGRSLGVHLILATQKPAGQVNEQIWSNSKFKLCLKVQDQQDSKEVIKSPLAAEIKEPGRAYLQVGNNEIFELLQSAYSGGPAVREEGNNKKAFAIYRRNLAGRDGIVYQQKKKVSGKTGESELSAIVKHISSYCKTKHIEKLAPICLPSLQDVIDYPEKVKKTDLLNFRFPVGVYDDPDNQLQDEVALDMAAGNVLVVGSVQTGKTNFLQLLMRTVGKKFSANEVNVYIMDFASMTLKVFEKMNHVGGVVIPGEDERLKNLFKLLREAVQERKERLLEIGVSSFNSYLEAGYRDYPRIMVFLDNFAVFKELYEETYEAEFQFLTREGPTYGICFVVTNARTAGFGYKYMSNFGTRFALNCNESAEYNNLFDRCRMEPKEVPGRMLFKEHNVIYEAQTYLAFKGSKEVERATAVIDFIEKTNAANPDTHARMIPAVPEQLSMSYMLENYRVRANKYIYPVGLDYATVDPVIWDMNLLGELSIVGKDSVKREKVVFNLLNILNYWMLENPVRFYILDSFDRPLKEWKDYPCTESYTVDSDMLTDFFSGCAEELKKRQEWMKNEETDRLSSAPLLLYIINNENAIDVISGSKDLTNLYQEITKHGKRMKVLFIFSAVDDAAAGYNAPAFLKKIRDNKKAVLAGKLAEVKLYDIPVSTVRAMKAYNPEDVYYLNGSNILRMKMIKERM